MQQAQAESKRHGFKWTLPRMILQAISLAAVNAIAVGWILPYFTMKPILIGLPILASVNSHYTALVGSLDLIQLELSKPEFPWIVIGTLLIIGSLVGRAFCGWVCPIGFIHDIMTTIRGKVTFTSPRTHKTAKNIKYIVLILTLLISGTLALTLSLGAGKDYKAALGPLAFGPYTQMSPDGTLFGTVPVLISAIRDYFTSLIFGAGAAQNPPVQITAPLVLRLLILLGFFVAAWRVSRFWCRYICPMGALMALFQKYSLVGLKRDPVKCSKCPHCEVRCPMQINILDLPWEKFNSPECIMCMECIDACPRDSLSVKIA